MCGVPQGSVLGPLLFGIFINHLPLCLSPKFVKCDLFADDGTLNTASDNIDNMQRDLQQSLNDISDWCCTDLMALNPTETKCVLMATGQNHKKEKLCMNFSLLSTPIEQISEHHLLGKTVDEQPQLVSWCFEPSQPQRITSGLTPKGGRGCLMSTPCLESQGCHLIPFCYFLSFSSA